MTQTQQLNKKNMQNTFKLAYGSTLNHCSKNKISLYYSNVENVEDIYTERYRQLMLKNYKLEHQDRLPGFATETACQSYSLLKNDGKNLFLILLSIVSDKHFRVNFKNNLLISSIGIGTYLGSPDISGDTKIFGALVDSITSGGVNHIDTASSYRLMKSERTIGAALRHLITTSSIKRDQLFIASKIGRVKSHKIYFEVLLVEMVIVESRRVQQQRNQQRQGKLKVMKQLEIVIVCTLNSWNNNQKYEEHFIILQQKSLSNLGLEVIDLLYIHNPVESQLPKLGMQKFRLRLAKCFEFLEEQVQKGNIKNYGMATWVCFRSSPEEKALYLPLQDVLQIAEQVGGKNHHFSYVQTPINFMMPEAFSRKWQYIINNGIKEMMSLLQVAEQLKVNIVSSSPLMNGSLVELPLPDELIKYKSLIARHLQFIRSIPLDSLKTTLIGSKTFEHIQENLEVIKHNPISPEDFWECTKPSRNIVELSQSII